MNKNLFRIIFNKRRGQLMAAAETSSSQGKGSIGESVASGHPAIVDNATVGISALSFAVLCALGAVLWALPTPNAHAQVVAYRNAPGNQQPTVLQTANGVPQVNIQTPSAAGVSHNVYSQFDVQSNGVILNNSRTNVQTQQGGWVQSNPWLATGSARAILNEVNSSNPSYLNGYVEVAGQRAEVVIANPSGISVNGGGFINTSKATLTTGTPIVNGGSLDGYRVQGGNISINGNGLDLSATDYSAILARAVQVNAGIWANELKVVTGANQIDASSLGANTTPVTTTIAGTGAVPSFALDVAQIGGMYAGKIHLIGTEQGLGVRSAGTIGSTGGDLVLQNNGWLTTTGTLRASQVAGGGKVAINAGNDVNARVANVQAKDALNVDAAGHVNIVAGQANSNFDEAHTFSDSGFMSSSTLETKETRSSSTGQASNFGGATVAINAGKDINVKGSNVVSDSDTTLTAGGNVNIEAAQNTSDSSSYRQETNSGLMGSDGIGISYGTRTQSNDGKDVTATAASSTVGSVGGNVSITTGNQYKQVGSDVLAPGQGGSASGAGNIDITAKTVDIQEARETNKQSTEQKFEQSGLTLAVTSTVLSTLENAQSQIKATEQTSDGRMKALGAASAAANVKLAADALKAGQGDENGMVKGADGKMIEGNAADKAGGIQVALSYGQSSSQSNSTATTDTALSSSVNAGGTVNIKATGDAQNSNLTVQGSDVSGRQVNLEADNQVNLLAAQNTSTQTSSISNSSASVGIALQLGASGGGLGVTGSVSKGGGNGNGSETTYTNTHVAGADSVNIKSGSDTSLIGATVEGKQVTATSGGNLNIQSLQDTATYAEQNKQIGASGMIGSGASGSVNYAKSNIDSNYASVTEQSGIKAGDGGFQVDVKGNTDLKGGAITSMQTAIDNNKNTFQTGGTLTTTDIENKANYEAKSVSVSVSAGGTPLPGEGLSAALSGAGMGKDSGSTSSTTTAGISGIAGDTAKRTSDNAQGIAKIFDADKVRQEIQAQTQITQEFSKQASATIASYSTAQKQTLQDQIKAASDADKPALKQKLDQVLLEEKVLNILVGAVTGFGETMVTNESLKVAAEQMREAMITDSTKFKGVVDSNGNTLNNNKAGLSEGVNGDGVKLGGTRVDLDKLCGADNARCTFERLADGSIDTSKPVKFNGNLQDFLDSPEGKDMRGLTGGVQGAVGTLFGEPYTKGSWQDKLIEAFAGSHDVIGGKLSGLYDNQGNAERDRGAVTNAAQEAWSASGAIVGAAPFAAAQGLPPEVWKAIGVLLKGGL